MKQTAIPKYDLTEKTSILPFYKRKGEKDAASANSNIKFTLNEGPTKVVPANRNDGF